MRKPRDYTLLAISIPFAIALAFNVQCGNVKQGNIIEGHATVVKTKPDYRPLKLLKIITERGLISIQYIDLSGDTVGLDYISVYGFNQLLKGNIDSVYQR